MRLESGSGSVAGGIGVLLSVSGELLFGRHWRDVPLGQMMGRGAQGGAVPSGQDTMSGGHGGEPPSGHASASRLQGGGEESGQEAPVDGGSQVPVAALQWISSPLITSMAWSALLGPGGEAHTRFNVFIILSPGLKRLRPRRERPSRPARLFRTTGPGGGTSKTTCWFKQLGSMPPDGGALLMVKKAVNMLARCMVVHGFVSSGSVSTMTPLSWL